VRGVGTGEGEGKPRCRLECDTSLNELVFICCRSPRTLSILSVPFTALALGTVALIILLFLLFIIITLFILVVTPPAPLTALHLIKIFLINLMFH
jgi:hypothetical protein